MPPSRLQQPSGVLVGGAEADLSAVLPTISALLLAAISALPSVSGLSAVPLVTRPLGQATAESEPRRPNQGLASADSIRQFEVNAVLRRRSGRPAGCGVETLRYMLLAASGLFALTLFGTSADAGDRHFPRNATSPSAKAMSVGPAYAKAKPRKARQQVSGARNQQCMTLECGTRWCFTVGR